MSSPNAAPALLMEDADGSSEVIVHPLVLLSVLDHHTRRQEADGRVIGTLLGRRDGDKIEITNCFAVPHAERGDEVAIGKDFNKQMLALHLRGNPREIVMGWYASASHEMPLIADTSSLIHEFYASESEDGDPIHLVVDTRLIQDSLAVKAYKSTPVQLQGEPLANLFHEVHLKLKSTESEAICLDYMTKKRTTTEGITKNGGNATSATDSTAALQLSMGKLLNLLEQTSDYVDQVVDGKIPPDTHKGRQLADTMATVPRIRPEVFDKLFDDSLQDLLMVTYLSNITRTQLTIAQKLNTSLGSAVLTS